MDEANEGRKRKGKKHHEGVRMTRKPLRIPKPIRHLGSAVKTTPNSLMTRRESFTKPGILKGTQSPLTWRKMLSTIA
jgi:hypothetical protein